MKLAFYFLCLVLLWFLPVNSQAKSASSQRTSINPVFAGSNDEERPIGTWPKDSVEEQHQIDFKNVLQDERIAFLLQAHRNAMTSRIGIPGYRVHLYMDSGNRARLNTHREQAAFNEKYPDQKSYVVYEEPYFKLRVGDFRTRLDARRFLEKIRRDYPAAYIVVDQINFPELD